MHSLPFGEVLDGSNGETFETNYLTCMQNQNLKVGSHKSDNSRSWKGLGFSRTIHNFAMGDAVVLCSIDDGMPIVLYPIN